MQQLTIAMDVMRDCIVRETAARKRVEQECSTLKQQVAALTGAVSRLESRLPPAAPAQNVSAARVQPPLLPPPQGAAAAAPSAAVGVGMDAGVTSVPMLRPTAPSSREAAPAPQIAASTGVSAADARRPHPRRVLGSSGTALPVEPDSDVTLARLSSVGLVAADGIAASPASAGLASLERAMRGLKAGRARLQQATQAPNAAHVSAGGGLDASAAVGLGVGRSGASEDGALSSIAGWPWDVHTVDTDDRSL